MAAAAGGLLGGADGRDRPLVEARERGDVVAEGARLVHEVDAGDGVVAGEGAGDVGQHVDVALLDPTPPGPGASAKKAFHAAITAGLSSRVPPAAHRRRRRRGWPTRGRRPTRRRASSPRARRPVRCGQRRAPGVLVQVEDRVHADLGEPLDGRRDLVEVGPRRTRPARARPVTTRAGGARRSRPSPAIASGRPSASGKTVGSPGARASTRPGR